VTTERLSTALAGRYRIERELGQGGMATVYLAEDLKHDRKVALKVLKPELAAVLGAERFVVEIKTTAALQHPHILPLFDSGTADGFLFYVMPFIDGETLRDKLNRETQIGIEEAVKITTEVADALDYAHRHGVIHRDIKPENILLHDGRPMVADFGIALAVSAAAGGRMTETGLSLGTPHYMSPEQATAAKEITARSDVYSLASVLYEMLAGEPPHHGGSAQQIIMKIVTDTARPVTQLRKSVPPNVSAAVAKALEKLPADRFPSAREFADALANRTFTHGDLTAALAAQDTGVVRVMGRRVAWRSVAAALAVVCVALVAALALRTGERTPQLVTRAELDLLTRSDSGVAIGGVDISPDGSMIVYSARVAGGSASDYNLYLRRIDEREAHVIAGTAGARYPVFSPDGQSIAFVFSDRNIRRVPVTGVVVESVVTGPGTDSFIRHLSWSRDGHIYYINSVTGLTRVPERGGTPKLILGDGQPQEPDPLPDGKHVLYTECCGPNADVRVVDIETGTTKSLGVQARSARYVGTGHLLLLAEDALKAVAFDPRKLQVIGEPVSVLDSVTANGTVLSFALSETGTAAYVVRPRGGGAGAQVTLVTLSGDEQHVALPEADYDAIRFSPDGRRLAFTTIPTGTGNTGTVALSVFDLMVGTTVRRSGIGSRVGPPIWTLDGSRILYGAWRQGDSVAVVASARSDGTGVPDTLLATPYTGSGGGFQEVQSLSPDGKHVLLQAFETTSLNDLVFATVGDSLGRPVPYLNAEWREMNGVISPDGKWVAYESNEGGEIRVYARSFPEPGTRFSVSEGGQARIPRWSPDGRTIYYWRGSTLVAATVRTTPTFAVTARRDLFTRPGARTFTYDVSPDGTQFVMAVAPTTAGAAPGVFEPPRLVLVVNWLEEFRRKMAGN